MLTHVRRLLFSFSLTVVTLSLTAIFIAQPAFGAELSYTADTTIALTSPAVNLIIKAGSEATSVTVNEGSLVVSLPVSTTFTITSESRDLTVSVNSPSTTNISKSCDSSRLSTVMVSTNSSTADIVTFTPSASQCTPASIGGGGGGGGGITPIPTTTSTPITPVKTSHIPGSNILSTEGTVYLITADYKRRPYTSSGSFLSYKFNSFSNLVTASPEDMALPLGEFITPRNGSLVNENGTIYIIVDGKKQGFASEAAFLGLSYSYSDIYPADISFMQSLPPIETDNQAHPIGTLINDNGTLFVITAAGKVGFPTMDIFNSWGYWVSEIVNANTLDMALPQSSVAQQRQPAQLNL